VIRGVARAYQGLVYVLLYLPIVVLIVFSFNDSRSSLAWRGFTTDWYVKLIEDGDLLVAAGNSAVVALLAATCATFVGTLTALALYRYRFHGKRLAEGLVFVLIMAPEIVMGISLLILFVALAIGLGFTTVLLAHVTFCLPFVTVTVLARLNGSTGTSSRRHRTWGRASCRRSRASSCRWPRPRSRPAGCCPSRCRSTT